MELELQNLGKNSFASVILPYNILFVIIIFYVFYNSKNIFSLLKVNECIPK